ncbi:helix-turn-helix transcriptional regulator [Chloroflexota bacterium]
MNTEKMTWSLTETARILGISRSLIYILARRNELPGLIHLGEKRVVCSKQAIEKLLQGNSNLKEN